MGFDESDKISWRVRILFLKKNNLQIFNELVLLVVKMQSCGDAKTGLSGCRISRQFFAKTTTSATTLRFRLNFGFFIK
jgi:hypothetical protein